MSYVREDRLCFLAEYFYIIIMGTIGRPLDMYKFYCTDITGTSHLFRGKQMVKSFAELGLKFDHQAEQFAFMKPMILKPIRNAAVQFPIF